ncbi:hypothetical protein [Lunatibacter salilacus]|uniref:hypothetical protein n=1 Tax=Lunatibacter salilacus TaxID=2483804 RepID=UPI00131DD54C|nr:hypothetical protein [Lunatibacter salilacus]
MNLQEISLFLTEPIVLIPEEVSKQAPTDVADKAISQSLAAGEDPADHDREESEIQELEIASYEGSFQKGLLILYQGGELSEASQTFLMNILKAVNHSLKDIALVSETDLLNGHPDSIIQLNPQNILIFGKLNHSIMKKKKEDYVIIQDDYTCLFSDDLIEIEANRSLKKRLWTALQLLFDIKS